MQDLQTSISTVIGLLDLTDNEDIKVLLDVAATGLDKSGQSSLTWRTKTSPAPNVKVDKGWVAFFPPCCTATIAAL
jgi:hypothetical protein